MPATAKDRPGARPYARVVTANALIEGDVVYLDAADSWSRSLEEARVFTDADSAEAALARASARSHEVVGAYLAEVRLTPQGPAAAHFREEFRRRGPSNRAHGKQANAQGSHHVPL